MHVPSPSTRSVITPIVFPNHKRKYVIFTEIPLIEVETILTDEEKMLKYMDLFWQKNNLYRCDALLILFDDESKASMFINDIGRIIPDSVPRVIVQTKYENGNLLDSYIKLSQSVKLNEIEEPTVPKISVKERNVDELIDSLYLVIEKP